MDVSQALNDLSRLMRAWAFLSIIFTILGMAFSDVIVMRIFSENIRPAWLYQVLLMSNLLCICLTVSLCVMLNSTSVA